MKTGTAGGDLWETKAWRSRVRRLVEIERRGVVGKNRDVGLCEWNRVVGKMMAISRRCEREGGEMVCDMSNNSRKREKERRIKMVAIVGKNVKFTAVCGRNTCRRDDGSMVPTTLSVRPCPQSTHRY